MYKLCGVKKSKFTGLKVLEIFKGFLPYLGMAAILNMSQRQSEQTFFKYVFNLLNCFKKHFKMLTDGRISVSLYKVQGIFLTFSNIIVSFADLAYLSDQISYLKLHTGCLNNMDLFEIGITPLFINLSKILYGCSKMILLCFKKILYIAVLQQEERS